MYSLCPRTGLALIKLSNPPVNSLGHGVRLGIARGIEQAHKDKVSAIVLTGEGKNFSAGADIAEFATGGYAKTPSLVEVIDIMETSTIPIVAGIDGVCLGGGMETALGAHWRVAGASAKLGLPEVHLGLLPGAGGTQRMPRLTGAAAAVDLIVSGRQIGAKEALKLGIVDHTTGDPIVDATIAFATSEAVKATPVEKRRISSRHVPGDISDELFEKLKSQVTAASRGFIAPSGIVEAIRWSAHAATFKEGMEKEKELFAKLFEGSQSKALQYFFFSERKATAPPKGDILPIQSAGVIGGGTMGAGIAMCLAQAGVATTLVESTDAKAQEAMKRIEKTYKSSSAYKSGKQTDADISAIMSKITPSGDDSFKSLGAADIVIEAIFENMDLKKQIFAKLDRVCKPGAILATNTSYLDIDEIGGATKRPQNVIGTRKDGTDDNLLCAADRLVLQISFPQPT
jgi:3-hydroxyacyl-CoA dehydrogenase